MKRKMRDEQIPEPAEDDKGQDWLQESSVLSKHKKPGQRRDYATPLSSCPTSAGRLSARGAEGALPQTPRAVLVRGRPASELSGLPGQSAD
jgi:hypothetical protein